MELINHTSFANLRLANFISPYDQLVNLTDWEFMGDLWIGEAIGFTEWLRLEIRPSETRSISINLEDFPLDQSNKIFEVLKVPLKPGMSYPEIVNFFGTPLRTLVFVSDRKSYEFIVGKKDEYYVSCTVADKLGLTYFVMMNHGKTIRELKRSALKI